MRRYVGGEGELCGFGGFPAGIPAFYAALARGVLRDGVGAGGVKFFAEIAHFFVHRDPVVAVFVVVPLAQELVAEAPNDDARAVSVAAYELAGGIRPDLAKLLAHSHEPVVPFVEEFVGHQYAVFVGEVEKRLRKRIVGGSDVVYAYGLQKLYAALQFGGVGGGPERSEVVVQVDAFQ